MSFINVKILIEKPVTKQYFNISDKKGFILQCQAGKQRARPFDIPWGGGGLGFVLVKSYFFSLILHNKLFFQK